MCTKQVVVQDNCAINLVSEKYMQQVTMNQWNDLSLCH